MAASTSRRPPSGVLSFGMGWIFHQIIYCLFSIWVVWIFVSGFFNPQKTLERSSTPGDLPTEPIFPKLEAVKRNPSKGEWIAAQYDRAVVIIVDALRYDFIAPQPGSLQYAHNNFKWCNEMLTSQPNNTRLFRFVADPPTATTSRVRAMMQGSLPSFLEVREAFGGADSPLDNIVSQLRKVGKQTVALGDEVWRDLFASELKRYQVFPSFDVRDIDGVDDGVLEHLWPELGQKDWTMLVAHFLGVDHIGHHYQVQHPAMQKKLRQMDDVVQSVAKGIDDRTLLIVLGDHGQSEDGAHGGGMPEETGAGLWVYSKKPFSSLTGDKGVIPSKKAGEFGDAVSQIDLSPTLPLLLGCPIPFGSLGTFITDLVPASSGIHSPGETDYTSLAWAAEALHLNAAQIHRYLVTYSREYPTTLEETVGHGVDFEGIDMVGQRMRSVLGGRNMRSLRDCYSDEQGSDQGGQASRKTESRECVTLKVDATTLIRMAIDALNEALDQGRERWVSFDIPCIYFAFVLLVAQLIVRAVVIRTIYPPLGKWGVADAAACCAAIFVGGGVGAALDVILWKLGIIASPIPRSFPFSCFVALASYAAIWVKTARSGQGRGQEMLEIIAPLDPDVPHPAAATSAGGLRGRGVGDGPMVSMLLGGLATRVPLRRRVMIVTVQVVLLCLSSIMFSDMYTLVESRCVRFLLNATLSVILGSSVLTAVGKVKLDEEEEMALKQENRASTQAVVALKGWPIVPWLQLVLSIAMVRSSGSLDAKERMPGEEPSPFRLPSPLAELIPILLLAALPFLPSFTVIFREGAANLSQSSFRGVRICRALWSGQALFLLWLFMREPPVAKPSFGFVPPQLHRLQRLLVSCSETVDSFLDPTIRPYVPQLMFYISLVLLLLFLFRPRTFLSANATRIPFESISRAILFSLMYPALALLGKDDALAFAWNFVAWLVQLEAFRRLKIWNLEPPPVISAVVAALQALVFFYSTGHRMTFTDIPVSAAFIGLKEFDRFWSPTLVFIRTYTAVFFLTAVLYGAGAHMHPPDEQEVLPRVASSDARADQYGATAAARRKARQSGGSATGHTSELVESIRNDIKYSPSAKNDFRHIVLLLRTMDTLGWGFSVRILAGTVSVFLLRRHLMVRHMCFYSKCTMFAPKYLYDGMAHWFFLACVPLLALSTFSLYTARNPTKIREKDFTIVSDDEESEKAEGARSRGSPSIRPASRARASERKSSNTGSARDTRDPLVSSGSGSSSSENEVSASRPSRPRRRQRAVSEDSQSA